MAKDSGPTTGPSAWLRGAFHELSVSECREMLGQKEVGRIAFWSDQGPTVLPVNYVVDSDGIRFRTSPYSSVAQQVGGSVVAFEVDETDDFTESGWSVLIRGVAEVLLGPAPGPGPDPEPWAEGVRPVTIRVPTTSISGRRVLGH